MLTDSAQIILHCRSKTTFHRFQIDDALKRVAAHEMGHTLCRFALTGGTDIVVVTIEQEGNGALGYVQHKNLATALPTGKDIKNEIVELMGAWRLKSCISVRTHVEVLQICGKQRLPQAIMLPDSECRPLGSSSIWMTAIKASA